MPPAFRYSKDKAQAFFAMSEKTVHRRALYPWRMAKPRHDWFLKEWLATLSKRQSDIVRDLEWNPARVSLMIRGKQPYTRDAVNDLSAYLHIRPHELLMHPDEAMTIRRFREDAVRIAAQVETDEPEQKVSLG